MSTDRHRFFKNIVPKGKVLCSILELFTYNYLFIGDFDKEKCRGIMIRKLRGGRDE